MKYLDQGKAEEGKINREKIVRGGYISLLNKLKMRFFEDFVGAFWYVVLKLFDSLSQKQLDAHNSENKEVTFYGATTTNCNYL